MEITDASLRNCAAGLTVYIRVLTFGESLDILEAALVVCDKVCCTRCTRMLEDGRGRNLRARTGRLG